MIFFADENISSTLAGILELFDRTHCVRGFTLRNQAEKPALRSAGLTFVLLARGWIQMPWHEMVWKMLKVWPGIVRDVERARRPTIFKVTVNLKVERSGLLAELR